MTPVIHQYVWGNNEKRVQLKGRYCIVEATGNMNTVLIRFLDTDEKTTSSRYALRPAHWLQP